MEKYYREKLVFDENKPLEFQALEWTVSDEQFNEDEPDEFVIRAFGCNLDGMSVCCTIRNFKPYFYIEVPSFWSIAHFKIYLEKLYQKKINGKNLINYYIKNTLLIKECNIEKWIPYYGFCNLEQSKYVKMVFSSNKGMKGYMYALKSLDIKKDELGNVEKQKDPLYLKLYDTNMDPLLKFFHLNEIQPSNHLCLDKYFKDDSSRCQIDVECDFTKVRKNLKNVNSPFLQASYDIETYSSPVIENGKENYPFPIPEKKENPIYQIATCFKKFGHDDFFIKNLLTLKKCSIIEEKDVVVEEFNTEKELLLRWIEVITNMDPDVIYSYNGNMFDDNYIWVRCKMLGITRELGKLSRLKEYSAKIKEASFSSSAYGTSEYKRLDIPGVVNYDILITIRRDFKENSYKLDNISEKYLGEKKNPVSPIQIFKAYETGHPDEIKKILLYCCQDTRLPQLLVDKLHILQGQISMSNVTYVTVKMLIERGQEVKALSQINMTAKKKGFLMPDCSYKNNIKGFEGATVLAPEVGLYDIVTVVDFEGLYPSIIRAHNLCYTSIVLKDEYKNLPGVEYIKVQFSEEEPEVLFVSNTETVLPTLLLELYKERKKYKKLMKEAENDTLKAIYDRTQLAVKVSANSIYGILGSKTLGCREIAASVTYFGREMIKQTKEYIEKTHHSIYPEGFETNVLDEDKHVTINQGGIEKMVKVSELLDIKDCLIKTDAGWREFTGLVQVN